MSDRDSSDTWRLLGFFALVIAAGTGLLLLPASWSGSPERPGPLPPVDALFIATSAVCVTGLSTVPTAEFSRFGQLVILGLIQVGGLGIISLTSLHLLLPGRRLSFRRRGTIRGFSVDGVETDPIRIVRNIMLFTFGIEAAGALALALLFRAAGEAEPVYAGLFHAVSAFCNAGFSLYPTSLEGFAGHPLILGVVALLITLGGIGFIVLQDLERRVRRARRSLSYHSEIVLGVSAILVLGSAAAYWLLERRGAFAGLAPVDQVANALFQAVTPRTAGFDAVPQDSLGAPARLLTIILMFVGGAPGSTAGGIKVSTAYLVLLVMLKSANERGEIDAFRRRFTPEATRSAVTYFLKACLLLLGAVAALSLARAAAVRGAAPGAAPGGSLDELVFEAVSAFGTVGLSLGLTPRLDVFGKLVIIATMYCGRVGLVALAFPALARRNPGILHPEADVMVG